MNGITKASIVLFGSSLVATGFVVRQTQGMPLIVTKPQNFALHDWEEYQQCYKRLGKDVKSCTLDDQGVTWTFRDDSSKSVSVIH